MAGWPNSESTSEAEGRAAAWWVDWSGLNGGLVTGRRTRGASVGWFVEALVG